MAPNRLASETSPYLLQHAHNPVDWYPWSEAALNRAQREDRPILLSIGYSACHWCHVMERESFEDPAIAELMNEHFVCIKVDREERPDVDDVYMAATIALTGSGGWPMTVFLTPEGAPFFAGTYFPPEDRGGRPGFRSLLSRIAELWEDDRDQLFRQAGELTEHLTAQAELGPPQRIAASVGNLAAAHLERSFDREWGGYGSAPKFPPSQALHLLLRHHVESGDVDALSQVTTTLDAMKNGGLYDQLGGGFARYSTDEKWLVPHFEKMLYDNAQLARVYLEAFQVTREPEYERIVTETLDFVIREMQAPEGGYLSAIDADSEGVEGKFYTFTTKELRALLEPEETRAFCAYYGVTEQGNFEGRNVLHTPESPRQVRERLRLSEEELDGLLRSARAKVFAAREERVRPAIDDKVLVSWNALMIGAMAEAGRVLGTVRHLNSGVRAAEFIFARLVRDDGRLLRTARAGTAHLAAYLEDYAYLVDALVDLYEATGVPLWLTRAESLAERLLADFHDPDAGAFFQTAHDHERLLFRARDGQDGALPNANAVAARALYRLGRQLDEVHFQDVARASLQAYGQRIARAPRAHLTAVNTLELMQREPLELAFAGSIEQTGALREAVAEHYLPRRVIGHAGPEPSAAATPLLAHKTLVEGKPALYICRNFRCERPITSPSDVAAALSVERAEVRAMRAHVLEGSATAEGTRAYHDAHALDPSAVHEIGDSGIRVSRVGFGTYRIQRDEPDHHRALAFALRGGCNLIDTAASYGRGESELAIGDVLGDLVRRGEIQRDQVVVVSKLGLIEAMERPVQPPNVELGQGLYHCVDPDWMERELSASLERLGIEALDVCLLHHPEALLLDGDRPRALDSLSRVFTWFEAQIERGRIRSYGLSTSGLSLHAPKPEATSAHWSLEELVASRERLGLAGLSVLELPLNPLELAVAIDGVLKSAAAQGFAVFTHRPLNALVGGELWRFAESSEQLDAPELAPSLELLRRLEDEFRSQLGAVLGAVPGVELDTDDWMNWSTHIAAQVGGNRASWNEFERGVLAPRSSRAIAGLDRAFAGKQLGRVWRVFRQRYTTQLEMTVLAARRAASAVTQGQLRPMAAAFRARRSAEAPGGSLAQSVVHTLGALPGVTSVLVGMRTPSYAREVLQTLGWETSDDPIGALRAAVESIESST